MIHLKTFDAYFESQNNDILESQNEYAILGKLKGKEVEIGRISKVDFDENIDKEDPDDIFPGIEKLMSKYKFADQDCTEFGYGNIKNGKVVDKTWL